MNRLIDLELKLTNSTMRGELHGDAVGRMASDIKVAGSVLVDKLKPLFLSEAEFYAVLGSKFHHETDDLICSSLKPLVLEREFEKCIAELNTAIGTKATMQVFGGSTLKDFKFDLKPGRCADFTATLQVYPNDAQWAVIANWRDKTLNVSVGGGEVVQPEGEQQQMLPVATPGDSNGKKPAPKRSKKVEDSAATAH